MFYGEDFLFVAAYMEKCNRVRMIREPVYIYYFNPKSLTVKQLKNSVLHPVRSIQVKKLMYHQYKALYKAKGLYRKYRGRIETYMYRVNLDD